MTQKPFFNPQPASTQDEEFIAKKKALVQQKTSLRRSLSLMIGDAQRETVENWLRTAETEDIETEYKGLLAAAKSLGPINDDYRQGIELARRVTADMARHLRINEKRTIETKKSLKNILDLVKNWDRVENKEEQIAKIEAAIEKME